MKAVAAKRSVSTQLMRWVFGFYCLIAVAVTILQMVKEYRHTQQEVVKELGRYQKIFGYVLARSIWDLDRERIVDNLDALFSVPIIVGIKIIKTDDDDIFMAKGIISENNAVILDYQPDDHDYNTALELLSYDFPLNYEFAGKVVKLADVTLYSNSDVVLSRVELGYLFLIVNAVIKSLALFVIFYYFSKIIILRPLLSLTNKINKINFDNLSHYDSSYQYPNKPNELDELHASFNALVDELSSSKDEIVSIKNNLEDEVLSRTSDLQEALNVKTRFLATMSHEIRTPMNGIIGMLDLLKKNANQEKEVRYIRVAKESADTLLSLVNDILDFSKIEAGKLSLENRCFDVEYLIKSVFESYRYEAKNKNINACLNLSDLNCKWLMGDATRLKQVFGNLLSNAIKFTEKGSVTMNVSAFNIDETCCQLNIRIQDTGIGIQQHAIADLFSDFTQADSSTTREFGGTGLGLAIVKQLVALMEGTIEVKSAIGEGSEFTLELPFKRAIKDQKTIQGAKTQKLYQGHVLLVEDNPINQEVALEILSSHGLVVQVVENGQQAIEKLEEESFELIFMDCQMPIMDGYTATREIRFKLENTITPVIAMTANAVSGDKEKCMACGMNDYLSKPIDETELIRVLEQYLVAQSK